MTANTFKCIPSLALTLALAACSMPSGGLFNLKKEAPVAAQTLTTADKRAKPRPDVRADTAKPLTPETASTVSDAEIAKAAKPTNASETDIGPTIASLGLLNTDGLWLSTPLVKSKTQGRVQVIKTGASVNLALLPSGAASGAGSQLSIAAMQALGVPITDLVPIRVFAQ